MNKKLCVACAGAFSLVALGCADDNISGSSEDPNVLTALTTSSSGSDFGLSSSKEIETLPNSTESSSSSSQDVSSSSLDEPRPLSSSSMRVSSSSFYYPPIEYPPILCKASGGSGCAGDYGYGDLWGLENIGDSVAHVYVEKFAEDPSKLGRDAGKWFWEADSADGGKSTIEWLEGFQAEPYEVPADSLLLYYGGIGGLAHLDKGSLTYYPFVSVGFNVAGFDSNGVALSADISNWNGICIVYTSNVAPVLSLDLGDSLNQELGMALPSVGLAKATVGTTKCFEWSDFEMPSWSKNFKYKISGEEAAKRVVRIVFRMQGQTDKTYNFNIMAVGTNLD